MDKQLVKKVLERLVEIDRQAEQLQAEGTAYQAAVEADVKRQSHDMEIDFMKAARARVKSEFSAANDRVDAEIKALGEQTEAHIAAAKSHYQAHKTSLVDDLFDAIFGEGA